MHPLCVHVGMCAQPAGVCVGPRVVRMHLGVRGAVCTDMRSGVLVHVCICVCMYMHSFLCVCVRTCVCPWICAPPCTPSSALSDAFCRLSAPPDPLLSPRTSVALSQWLQSRVGREESGGAPWGGADTGGKGPAGARGSSVLPRPSHSCDQKH